MKPIEIFEPILGILMAVSLAFSVLGRCSIEVVLVITVAFFTAVFIRESNER